LGILERNQIYYIFLFPQMKIFFIKIIIIRIIIIRIIINIQAIRYLIIDLL